MPIQFPCDNCRRKIEVDDEYAGRQAQCPYCETIVLVPAAARPQSDFVEQPESAPGSAGGFEPRYGTPTPPLPTAPTNRRDRNRQSAFRWALASVLCGLVATGLYLVAFTTMTSIVTERFGAEQVPTAADMQEFIEDMQDTPEMLRLAGLQFGGLLATLIGLVFGIVSLAKSARANALGWFGVLIAGGWVLVICSGAIAAFTL